MSVRFRNALAPAQQRHRVEHAVRAALEPGLAEFEAVITPAVDPWHAEILIFLHGQRRAAYFADLHQSDEELSKDMRRALRNVRRG